MKGDKYVLTVRNQQRKILHRSEYPFTKEGRMIMKITMRSLLYITKEKVLARGFRVAGPYYDVTWYGCNNNNRVYITTRSSLSKQKSPIAYVVYQRIQLFKKTEDDRYEDLQEEAAFRSSGQHQGD